MCRADEWPILETSDGGDKTKLTTRFVRAQAGLPQDLSTADDDELLMTRVPTSYTYCKVSNGPSGGQIMLIAIMLALWRMYR